MTRQNLTFCFLFLVLLSFGQGRKRSPAPFFFFDYTYQKTSNFTFAVGPIKYFKRHTYIGLLPGITLLRTDNASYLRPTGFLEYYYRPKILKGIVGPVCRLGFLPIKMSGQTDNYLTADLGLRIYWVTIYGGYNFCLDKKDLNNISNYRFGIRFP